MKWIVGRTAAGDVPPPGETGQFVGVKLGPASRDPTVWANTPDNVRTAVNERLVKKQLPFLATDADKQKMSTFVRYAMGLGKQAWSKEVAPFSEEKVKRWFAEHVHADLTGMASGKWSQERVDQALDGLYTTRTAARFRLKGAVKLEPMPPGKPPRFLIADGDEGQLMAIYTIACFEDLMFEWFINRCIKHVDKKTGVQRVASALKHKVRKDLGEKVLCLGGDGTAWDTCNSLELRNLLENPILWHITEIGIKLQVAPAAWLMAHGEVNEKPKLALQLAVSSIGKILNGSSSIKIDNIRRSGHRGTSCLNWWINFSCWHCCLFRYPWMWLNPARTEDVDTWNELRPLRAGFEGDDSALSTVVGRRKLTDLRQREADIVAWWTRHGFRMKLEWCVHERGKNSSFKFVGWDIHVNEEGPSGIMAPELGRCLAFAGYSCSPAVREAAKKGDYEQVRGLMAAKFVSRAAEMAEYYPLVARTFVKVAEALHTTGTFTRDDTMRTGGLTYDEAREFVLSKATTGQLLTDANRATKLGYPCSAGDLLTLDAMSGDDLLVCEDFSAVLPPTWR